MCEALNLDGMQHPILDYSAKATTSIDIKKKKIHDQERFVVVLVLVIVDEDDTGLTIETGNLCQVLYFTSLDPILHCSHNHNRGSVVKFATK